MLSVDEILTARLVTDALRICGFLFVTSLGVDEDDDLGIPRDSLLMLLL